MNTEDMLIDDSHGDTYPRHTEIADFLFNESGELQCTLNIDFKDFDVSHESYFNGDNICTKKEYESVFNEVAKACNESCEYTIDCWNGRYTVRKSSEIEKVRYDAMSKKEKSEYNKQKHIRELWKEKATLMRQLSETDYIHLKVAEGDATLEDYEDVIAERKKWRAKVSEIKEELGA